MASGRHVEYRLTLNSNASTVLNQDSAAANKFDNSMWQLQKTLASFGLGLGAHFLIDASKQWIQAAADYESAMLRIRNASIEGFGIFNESFLNNQVDKFKTKLQETADAYGGFLFKIKNAGLSNDVSNRLFENLSMVGKVSGIDQNQMDATVRNVGIMLGEGVLEARHLRQLSYVHPQLIPFLADAMGLKSGSADAFSGLFKTNIDDETAQQKLSQLISSGKLTKSALSSKVLIDAVEHYRESIEGKLPETLTTLQSQLNDLSNTWERFKNSLVLGQKPELVSLFDSLKDDINWLHEHEEGLIKFGKVILDVAEAWLIYKGGMLAINIATNSYNGISSLFTSNIIKEEVAVVSLNSQVSLLSANMERLAAIQTQFAISSGLLSTEQAAMLTTGVLGGEAGASAAKGLGMGTILGGLASSILIFSSAIWAFGSILDTLKPSLDEKGKEIHWYEGQKIFDELNKREVSRELMESKNYSNLGTEDSPVWILNSRLKQAEDIFDIVNNTSGRISSKSENWINHLKKIGLAFNGIENEFKDVDNQFFSFFVRHNQFKPEEPIYPHANIGLGDVGVNQTLMDKYLKPKNSKDNKVNVPKIPEHHIRGNSTNYWTVHINTMNGMNNPTFTGVTKETMEDVKQMVGVEMTRNMLQVINDIQISRVQH